MIKVERKDARDLTRSVIQLKVSVTSFTHSDVICYSYPLLITVTTILKRLLGFTKLRACAGITID